MTTVYLVRHAHADWSPDDGRSLSARGRNGAAALDKLLAPVPVAAIYSSPARRALETVEGLTSRLRLEPIVLDDLRERKLVVATAQDFEAAVEAAWLSPMRAEPGSESNAVAQGRGLSAIRKILDEQTGLQVVVATHGNLLALILNSFKPALGFAFWRTLTFPDVYELRFQRKSLVNVRRIWDAASAAPTTSVTSKMSPRM
jgi:2,3-bisphosphoglycerate-dependent phosphoglycerate mutase